jgi:hypothetical protein
LFFFFFFFFFRSDPPKYGSAKSDARAAMGATGANAVPKHAVNEAKKRAKNDVAAPLADSSSAAAAACEPPLCVL